MKAFFIWQKTKHFCLLYRQKGTFNTYSLKTYLFFQEYKNCTEFEFPEHKKVPVISNFHYLELSLRSLQHSR